MVLQIIDRKRTNYRSTVHSTKITSKNDLSCFFICKATGLATPTKFAVRWQSRSDLTYQVEARSNWILQNATVSFNWTTVRKGSNLDLIC